jgi:type IV secretion system protein VirB9
MSTLRKLACAAAFLCLAGAASAQEAPARDPRVRVVAYQADQVIAIQGHLGYQLMIEFDLRERIENVSIGDSLGWQVTPNRAATLLFLKPVVADAATNMTVVTNRRRYAFSLRSGEANGPDDPRILYSLRFSYPDEAPTPSSGAAEPASFNFNYAVSGSPALMPTRVFDDGRVTYFEIPPNAETPAIFLLNARGEEEVVNSQVRGGFIAVDQIADAFVLRYGADRAVVRNGVAAPETPAARRARRGRRS